MAADAKQSRVPPSALHTFVKMVTFILIVAQVVMWPSVATIFMTSLYGAISLGRVVGVRYMRRDGHMWSELNTPGIMLLHSGSRRFGLFTLLFTLHFALFFLAFVQHESSLLPAVTSWLPAAYLGNYSFEDGSNNALPGEVTDPASIEMRSNPFVWPRNVTFAPAVVSGLLSTSAGPFSNALACAAANGSFACFAPRMLPVTPPTGAAYASRRLVPLTSDFYDIDVRITPPAGVACADLEVLFGSRFGSLFLWLPLWLPLWLTLRYGRCTASRWTRTGA